MSREHHGVPCKSLIRNHWNTKQDYISTQQVHSGCRWKREGCTQRDLRGDGYSNSSRERLTWTKIVRVGMERAQECVQIVVEKQNRQDSFLVEWILLEERDGRERKKVRDDSQVSCLY